MNINLPKKVIVLDIEGDKVSKPVNFNKIKAYVAGVKEAVLYKGKYKLGKYDYYLPKDFKYLERRLATFPGIILGHNLFAYDYKVLKKYMDLKKIINKTVDTLYFLNKSWYGNIEGTSLDNLALHNIGKRKKFSGKSIPQMWKKGFIEKVIRYNERDLNLTAGVWEQVLLTHRVRFKRWFCLVLEKNDLTLLTGQKTLLDYKTWKKKKKVIDDYRDFNIRFQDFYRSYAKEYFYAYCNKCKRIVVWKILLNSYFTEQNQKVECNKHHFLNASIDPALAREYVGNIKSVGVKDNNFISFRGRVDKKEILGMLRKKIKNVL
ncbi:MAG TPA: hypothetical protein ENN43_03425 [bacterium]|nr:hypothetical protein [bacterium]